MQDSGVGQLGVPVGLITRRSMVQIHPPLFSRYFKSLIMLTREL